MFDVLEKLFTFNPADLDQDVQDLMVKILKARSESQIAQGQLTALRAQVWLGVQNLDEVIALKAKELTNLRKGQNEDVHALLKLAIDLDSLLEVLPSMGLALMEQLQVPLPALLEGLGVDFDGIKLVVDGVKELAKQEPKDDDSSND